MLSRKIAIPFRLSSVIVRNMVSGAPCVDEDVLFEDHGNKGLIILNKPKSLNALNHSMALKIYPKLKQWDNKKELIVIKGCIEKAFCAGGDIVALTRDKTGKIGREYFTTEYINNAQIATLKTPYLAIIHGIVMGGGVGLSIHGKYRVASETSMFAMPETAIGLFPDVGVSYFLSRMPNNLGMYLALTGHRLKGYDLFHTGIATHFCHSSLLPALEKEVLCMDTNVKESLQNFHCDSLTKFPEGQGPPFSLAPHIENIEHCFGATTVEEVIERLRAYDNDFSKNAIKLISTMSPTSLKVTLRQIREAAHMNVYEVLNMDYRLAWRFLSNSDFYEGVRALLVDKDKRPKWSPTKLADVDDTVINSFFEPLNRADELDLPRALER